MGRIGIVRIVGVSLGLGAHWLFSATAAHAQVDAPPCAPPAPTAICITVEGLDPGLSVCLEPGKPAACVCLLGECIGAGGGFQPPADGWGEVSAGSFHSCAIRGDQAAYCWGYAAYGRLGNGDTTTNQTRPVLVSGGYQWSGIASGEDHSCGITSEGSAYCWGLGTSGQLGNGSTSQQPTPALVSVSGSDSTWAMLSAGWRHSCGITTSGTAYCWGQNHRGQLGSGNTDNQTTRVPVAGGRTWKSISAGRGSDPHSCAVTTSGTAYCWGGNQFGQVGDGAPGSAANPSPIPVTGGHSWHSVTTGDNHSCGITTTGAAYCWGANGRGQLGTGNTANESEPKLVLGNRTWQRLEAGPLSTCGITTGGDAYCWGANSSGQVGNDTTGFSQTSPAPVTGDRTWVRITSGGNQHACGIADDGDAFCWGDGSSGQLGAGSPTRSTTPIAVADPQ